MRDFLDDGLLGLSVDGRYYIISKKVPKGLKRLAWPWYIDTETKTIYSSQRKRTKKSQYIVATNDKDVLPLINW